MARDKKPKTHVPNPWDRPAFPKMGDATEDITFAAVGRALSQWENFELDLSTIFALMVGNGNESIEGQRAYGSVASFVGRKEMLEAAAEAFFFRPKSPPVGDNLYQLLRRAKDFSARRNEIAHGIVFPHGIADEHGRLKDVGFCLFPPMYNTRRSELFGFPMYIYSSVEILYFAEQFAGLGLLADHVKEAIDVEHASSPRKYRALAHQPI